MTDKTAGTENWEGQLFYDESCRLCRQGIARLGPFLRRIAVQPVPFEDGGAEPEMRLRWHDGREFGGADAAVFLADRFWWTRPLAWLTRLPGGQPLADLVYRQIASRRHCFNGACELPAAGRPAAPLPLWIGWTLTGVLVTLAIFASAAWFPGERPTDAWWTMWLVAVALWLGFKSLAWSRQVPRAGLLFLFWPGMDAAAFARDRTSAFPSVPRIPSIPEALGFLGTGLALLLLALPYATEIDRPLIAGWMAMMGIVFVLHFGLFALLARGWYLLGFPVLPLMNTPWRAASLGNFWGDRWNRGFSVVARIAVFRPLVRRLGLPSGTLAGFLVSGLAHELVISLPARAGWGLPTIYFLLQGAGVLLERILFRESAGPITRRAFTWAVILLPAPLLFHPPFFERVLLPGFAAL